MNIEELMNLKEILLVQKSEDQCVVISTKRSFLPEYSNLYVRPMYARKSEIESEINTARAIEKTEKNIEELLRNAIRYYNYNSQKIEESFTTGIVLDREKYEQICEKLHKYSEKEILTKDICDSEIFSAVMHNIVELQPYMMKHYNDIPTKTGALFTEHVCVEPTIFVEFDKFYEKMKKLGYTININKESTDSKTNDPYEKLFLSMMENSEESINTKYCNDLVITVNLIENNSIKRKLKK